MSGLSFVVAPCVHGTESLLENIDPCRVMFVCCASIFVDNDGGFNRDEFKLFRRWVKQSDRGGAIRFKLSSKQLH